MLGSYKKKTPRGELFEYGKALCLGLICAIQLPKNGKVIVV